MLRESLRTDLIVLAFLWSSESAPGEAAALVFREDQMCSLEGDAADGGKTPCLELLQHVITACLPVLLSHG